MADVWGRLEAFSLSVFLFTLGYIQQAAANNVKTYAAAQIFYASGQTGLQILQQIFIADTSDLLNRALVSTIPDIPYLLNVWIGPPIAESILENLGWRWGYGIWAIVLPIAFMPLALSLLLNQRKAAKRGLLPPSPFSGLTRWNAIKSFAIEMDFFGLLLLLTGVALVLVPLTLSSSMKGHWANASLIAMLVVGVICLILFPFWERSPKLAPRAFFPPSLYRNRTVMAGMAYAFFYFMAYYLSVQPYFYSYLLVVQDQSVTEAGHITQTFTFASTVTSILISLAIKYTKHYKYYVTAGSCIYLVGIVAMLRYRTEGTSPAMLVVCQILVGMGGGLSHVPAQLGVQASASHSEVGAATAAFLTTLEIGGAVGSAISGSMWSNSIPGKLEEYLPEGSKHHAKKIFGSVQYASTHFPVGSPERIAINRAYQETMTSILMIAVVVALPLMPLSLLMKNYKLDEVSLFCRHQDLSDSLTRPKMDQQVKGVVIGSSNESTEAERLPFAGSSTRQRGYGSDEDADSIAESMASGKTALDRFSWGTGTWKVTSLRSNRGDKS